MSGSKSCLYLLLDEKWLGAARELEEKDKVFKAITSELKLRCDRVLDMNDSRFLDADDLDSFWWRNRIGTKQLVVTAWDLAMAAVYFDSAEYRNTASRILLNLAENNMAEKGRGSCYSYFFRSWMQHVLDAGHASEGLGMSFDLMRPSLTEEQVLGVGNYLKKFIAAGEKFIEDEGGPGQLNFQNQPMIGRFGLGVLAMALEKAGLCDGSRHVDAARFAALEYLDHGGHEEGILPEGPMYGFACLKHISVLGTILKSNGDSSIWDSSGWDSIVEAYASQMVPNEEMPNPLNDCYPVRCTSWLLDAARQRRNGLAMWLWKKMVRPLGEGRWDAPVPWNDIRAPWWNALLPHALVSYDPSVKTCSPEEYGLPLQRHFTNRGIYDCRTGWDADDWFLSVTCAPDLRWRNRGGELHTQADRGHFSFYALGEQFAIDSGYGNELLEGTTEVIRFGATGEAHNVPEIGGEMQQFSLYSQGIRDLMTDGWARLARMHFAECYSNCSRACRTIAVVTDENEFPMYVAVYDSVVPRILEKKTFGLFLHTHKKNEVCIKGRETAELEGGFKGNRCKLIMTGTRPGRLASGDFIGHPRLHYQNEGSSLCVLTLLVPYYKGEEPPVLERTPVADPGPGKGLAVNLRFRGVNDVLFHCAEGKYSAFGYETDADFAVIRSGQPEKFALLEGTVINRADHSIFFSEQRTDKIKS